MTDDKTTSTEFIRTLLKLEADGERATLAIGPYSAFILISMLQLSTRQSDLTPRIRQTALDICRLLYPLFTNTPGEEMLRRGEHPEWDVKQHNPRKPKLKTKPGACSFCGNNSDQGRKKVTMSGLIVCGDCLELLKIVYDES